MVQSWTKRWQMCFKKLLPSPPILQWLFVYFVPLIFFFSYRLAGMHALIYLFGYKKYDTASTKFEAVALGFLEDFIWTTYLVFLLLGCDCAINWLTKTHQDQQSHPEELVELGSTNNCLQKCFNGDQMRMNRWKMVVRRLLRFVVYFTLFVLFAAPFAADVLLVTQRQMRFTFDLITLYLDEKDAASNVVISDEDKHETYKTVSVTATVALIFSTIGMIWIDLSQWNPMHLFNFLSSKSSKEFTESDTDNAIVYLGMEHDSPTAEKQSNPVAIFLHTRSSEIREKRLNWLRIVSALLVILVLLVVIPIVGIAVSHSASYTLASVALNASMNEYFKVLIGQEFMPAQQYTDINVNTSDPDDSPYLNAKTEKFTLFARDGLYRRTNGFYGDLAFNVSVDPADPPNVLMLVVESFRYHDSQYLVGNNTYLLKNSNVSVTPNFDKWAKRGIAFRNFWSSWRTSRSVESILFAQLPYDSATYSGTSGGNVDVKLSGMPQFFKAKGYEPIFTTGCRTDYDEWDEFLPAHGFDQVLSMNEMKKLAEKDLGINPKDWALVKDGGKARAHAYWGVHDDVSFQILGNLMINKTEDQQTRRRKNEAKQPFFITHYTISSHTPFWDRPQWYEEDYKYPDFSALYEGEEYADDIRRYLEMRYFTDLELGKFLDRMDKEGILNDTIIMIVGDHGQGPEVGLDVPEALEISATRVAATLIAEGRLGEDAGMIFDDAVEHYDLLNTLADIVGVPEEGFIQTGVGRSLKRKVEFGETAIWSNNPSRKMAAVRDHHRLQYDAHSDAIALHDTEADHYMKHDLFPFLSVEEQDEWLALRDAGRTLNSYFKERWDKKCLLNVDCK